MSAAPGRSQARSHRSPQGEGTPVTAPAYRINGVSAEREAFYVLACDPTRSIAVEACAGAGKTWMLVSRILRALLDGCAPQDILAITFTKKAAGEMRDRLNTELRRWSGLSDEQLTGELRARGLSAADALRRVPEARGLHARVNALGRTVQVRTFHSWFAALLRGSPLSVLQDMQLPVQYELLEDDARAVAQVWPRFYAALAASPADRQDFMDSVAQHGRHQTLVALKKALDKRVEFALADAAGVVAASVEPFAERYPALGDLATPELALLRPEARSRWHAWAKVLGTEANKTPKDSAAKIIDAFELPDEPSRMQQRLALLRKAFLVADEDRLNSRLAKFEAAQAAELELIELCGALRQHRAWAHHQRMARLARVLLASYAALKRERGWVDMNDVEGAARRLLGDAELSGWLQQRLDARVRHVLIDEFQDTNPLQWQALYGWLSAYAGAGPGEAPCVFLVGDPKQSIYRFRRAEPQVFKAAQAFVVQGLSGALLSCDHTRRCAPAVVEVLNAAMGAAVQAGQYSSDYRAHTTESTAPGEVRSLPQLPRSLRDRHTGACDSGEWRDSLTTPRVLPEDSLAALEAAQAADWVALQIEEEGLHAGDIMVLARRRERLGWMHEALRERGILSEQPEKLDLGESPAVLDVVALLDALVSTRHDLSLARALKSPLCGWSDDDLAQLARLRTRWTPPPGVDGARVRPSWWDVLQRFGSLPVHEQAGQAQAPEQATRFVDTAQRLALYRDWLRTLPPHDALSALYDHGDVLARFAQHVPPGQRAAVLAQLRDLLTQSLAQDGGRFLTTYRFVRALKAGGIKATAVQTPDAVRLLTVHGAKGLEAHTVLMLDTDTGPARPESMGVLVDWPGEAPLPRRFVFLASEKAPPACAVEALQQEQEARALEELNGLYVAMTRAESRLLISSFEPHLRANAPTWYQRLQPLAAPMDTPPPATTHAQSGEGGNGALSFELLGLPAVQPAPAPTPAPAAREAMDDTASRIGLALHRLLQWWPTPSEDFDWGPEHAQAVAREFALDTVQARDALAMARRIIGGDAAWAWDAELLHHWGSEVELFHQGELLRLDRLVRRRDTGEWWVLDHKSAAHPERQPALIAQMRGYRQAVAAANPGDTVRLAFINAQGRLIELQD
ncbi:UvrD-helicase domain-containing protein [Hydrogenophaga sp. BPS33]|uniref:UvrD-helicase domain-containing protein n=1 Tax=Hydrogenophaga sp. BPS33 TaxID=2651974 RepID=UPI0013203438|nr:UvrD-helicase domain-containing protein [Hydrogenophaga sp. BPS33]QHE86360.1 AAA family ATPase [Hydrogenophaga sp. BPS33]